MQISKFYFKTPATEFLLSLLFIKNTSLMLYNVVVIFRFQNISQTMHMSLGFYF